MKKNPTNRSNVEKSLRVELFFMFVIFACAQKSINLSRTLEMTDEISASEGLSEFSKATILVLQQGR